MLLAGLFAAFVSANAQRNIAEATIVYDMVIQTGIIHLSLAVHSPVLQPLFI